ncbi:MAG: penicillin-binding protein 2 [Deltaproteobacteria bacterium]|nr:penicillin-binding protein 2 [Deltaproteobacteria bacterium]
MEIAGQDAELPEIRHRSQVLSVIVALVLLALAVRLFYLQIIQGDDFYRMTAENIIRTISLPATRGQIRDHKGRVLAVMVPSYDVEVHPSQLARESYDYLRALLGPDVERLRTFEEIATEAKGKDRTLVVAENVSREVMAVLETSLDKPGIHVAETQRRHYPYGGTAAHAVGYMNEVSAEELKTLKEEGYQAGDTIGRAGIERQWEPYLRGRKGFKKVVINRRGLRRTDVHIADLVTDGPISQQPSAGNDVVLTLDLDVQKIVERALRGVHSAAAVVIDIATGRILAIASKPAFDPNMMSGGGSPERLARVLTDRLRPLRDKALSDTFNPGSTFKVITALAGLEEKVVVPEDKVKCTGRIQIGRRRFRCTKAHKTVNLYDAIVQSCNVFFYDLGARPGMMNRMAKYAADFGLGAPSGLGLNGEQAGFIPTEEWHRARDAANQKGDGFAIGHALNTAIGEGATRATVLQMALLYAAIGGDGKLWLPQIVERVESPDGQIIEDFPPRVRREVTVSPESLAFLRRALYGVIFDAKGTAHKSRPHHIEIAGKTGTAQVFQGGRRGGDEPPLPYERVDHAWFAGFAPATKPRIAFAVLVEHGGHGGAVAAPVAVEIVENYFDTVVPPEERAHLSRRGERQWSAGAAKPPPTSARRAKSAAGDVPPPVAGGVP